MGHEQPDLRRAYQRVVKVPASRVDAYEWLQALIRAVQERAGSVTASMIRATLMAAPGSPWGL